MDHPYHTPVMVEEVSDFLITDPAGIYIDGTLGGGGHALHLLNRLHNSAIYIGIDQDPEAIAYATDRLSGFSNAIFRTANFSRLDSILDQLRIHAVNGILLDLGVSSRQIDSAARGFSYMQSAELDMRMDTRSERTAADLVNRSSAEELAEIFRRFGEERHAGRLARHIVTERSHRPIMRAEDLREVIDRTLGRAHAIKNYSRIFQALRIALNHELDHLQRILEIGLDLLEGGGRLVIIAYHSLEDRIVKRFMADTADPCICPDEFPQCVCGRQPRLKVLTRKAVRPSAGEIEKNPRARSARLRTGEKI